MSDGRRLARRRLPEGLDGVTRAACADRRHLPEEWADLPAGEAAARVKVGIETDRGPWVPRWSRPGMRCSRSTRCRWPATGSGTRPRGRSPTPGMRIVLAEIVRLDRAHHRPVAGDSPLAEAIKLVARAHQSLIWDRTRHVLRLRSALREFFPAALQAFADLDAPDALELLAARRTPTGRRALSRAKITAALRPGEPPRRRGESRSRSRPRCGRPRCGNQPRCRPRSPRSSPARSALITALNAEIEALGEVVADHFGRHPDAEIYASQPGLGVILGARVLAEFGDDPHRYAERESPQELRRHLADHPGLRHQEGCARPLRPQPPTRPTPCSNGPSCHCAAHPAPAPTTTPCAPAASATRPLSASSPTASSASCTAASKPHPLQRTHRLAPPQQPLDIPKPGMSAALR